MWFTKKQKENWILNNRDEIIITLNNKLPELNLQIIDKKSDPPKEEPKPTERKCIMEIVLINNKTDKEYIIKSENDFGVSWKYETGVNTKGTNVELLIINQYYSEDKNGWTAVGRFIGFSILKCNWKTFDIKPEEQEKK